MNPKVRSESAWTRVTDQVQVVKDAGRFWTLVRSNVFLAHC